METRQRSHGASRKLPHLQKGRSLVLASFLIFIWMSTLVLPARAQGSPSLSLTPDAGPPGTRVTVVGTGFTAGAQVDVLLIEGLGLIVAETTASEAGSIRVTFTVPQPGRVAELTFGPTAVFAIEQPSGRESERAFFTIVQAARAGGPDPLLVGGLLAGVGLLLLVIGLRWQRRPA